MYDGLGQVCTTSRLTRSISLVDTLGSIASMLTMLVKNPQRYVYVQQIQTVYRNHPKERYRDYPVKDYDSTRHCACVSTGYHCRCQDYPDKDYDSLVTALAFFRHAGIFGRFLTFCIFIRHQFGFRTEHLKNDIRECCYPGKRTRPDTSRPVGRFRRTYQREKAVSVSCSTYSI
jgi:hypothetical protein